jgi:hypothetical protein
MRAPSPWGSRPTGDLEFPRCRTCRARFRPPIHPYTRRIPSGVTPHGLAGATSSCIGMQRRRWESALRREFEFSDRDWASRSLPLALPRGSRGTFAWLTWAAPASPACCGPPCLSTVGEPDDPGSIAREPPSCGRDTTPSHSTHTRLHFKVPPLARSPGICETTSRPLSRKLDARALDFAPLLI